MALIKCPECGKEISDKSDKCIHCGYPIRNSRYIHECINDKEYDLSFLIDKNISKVNKIKMVKEISGCDLKTAKAIADKYHPTEKETHNMPRCPKCGSTNITASARGVNMVWGFIGASKTVNRCANCGHTWKP